MVCVDRCSFEDEQQCFLAFPVTCELFRSISEVLTIKYTHFVHTAGVDTSCKMSVDFAGEGPKSIT